MKDAGLQLDMQSSGGAGLAGVAIGTGNTNGTVVWRYIAQQKQEVFEVGVVQDSVADIGSALVLNVTVEAGADVGAGTTTDTRSFTAGTISSNALTTTFRGKALNRKFSFVLEKGFAIVVTLTTKSANASVTGFLYFQAYPGGQGAAEAQEQVVTS